jgi:hypothetical protein
MTALSTIYEVFLSKITDDMYLELTPDETYNMLFDIFQNSLHWFEFPRFDIYSYNEEVAQYFIDLSQEEINIIANYMVVEWINQ